jgi:hypothetical protein
MTKGSTYVMLSVSQSSSIRSFPMNTTIPQLSQAMRQVLGEVAHLSALKSGFTQRRSKLSGAVFVQTLVLGWLNNPQASLESLTQTAAALGVKLSPQGLDYRFSPQAADCLREVLEAAVSKLICAVGVAIPVFERFSAVIVQDSSIIVLPQALKEHWQGCGGSSTQMDSAIKLSVGLDLSAGTLRGPVLAQGRTHDQKLDDSELPQGALRLTDLGYFNLEGFSQLDAEGAYFISRLKSGTKLFSEDGSELVLPDMLCALGPSIDVRVQLGARQRLRVRLLGVRVPHEVAAQRKRKLRERARKKMRQPTKTSLRLCEWTLLITNAPDCLVSLEDALVLSRARWQIEMLFKLWKQHGQIDEWRSKKPYRILCEIYAKLVAMLIQHWILLVSCWSYPDRSLIKAAQTVSSYAVMLVSAMAGLIALEVVIGHIASCIGSGCRMNTRKAKPNTYQLLLNLDQGVLP